MQTASHPQQRNGWEQRKNKAAIPQIYLFVFMPKNVSVDGELDRRINWICCESIDDFTQCAFWSSIISFAKYQGTPKRARQKGLGASRKKRVRRWRI